MKVVVSLLMVIALAWLARWLSSDVLNLEATPQVGAVMSVGLLMLGGWLSGKLFERIQLPGITGYAQITQGYTGKDERAYRAKLAADQHYRRNFSLRLDLEILFRTPLWMLRGRGWGWRPREEESPETATQRDERSRAYARFQ